MKILYSIGLSANVTEHHSDVPAGEYNNTWFDPHIHYWKKLREWAAEQRAYYGRLCFLEIGCFEGRSAAWLLKNMTTLSDSFVIVDPWGPGPEWQPIYERAMRNLNLPELLRPAVIRSTSADFWAANPVVLYDFVYVDGSHKAPDVEADVLAAWARLRPGGIILADDFYNPHTPGEERDEVEKGLRAAHQRTGWPWPPERWGIDVLYQRVLTDEAR